MDRGSARRWPARLRAAKLIDASRRFLIACRNLDHLSIGARLRPPKRRPLPLYTRFQDADLDVFAPATIVWIRKGEIGIGYTAALRAVG